MRFLHVIHPDYKFAKGAVSFLDTWFDKNEHQVLYVNEKGNRSLVDENVKIFQKEFFLQGSFDVKTAKQVIDYIKKYDYIVFHSLFFHFIIKFLVYFEPNVLSKILWIEFGGDLYLNSNKESFIRRFIAKKLTAKIANTCKGVVCIFPPDCDAFRKMYPFSKAEIFYAPYCEAQINEFFLRKTYNNSLLKKHKTNDDIIVQIGHNGNESLNHLEVIDSLAKYSCERIKILLILNYGGCEAYYRQVQAYAERMFPNKCICIRNFLSAEEYYSLIDDVDICVFDTFRQAGLANVNRMIWNNTKLFMPSDSVMYKFFSSKGVAVSRFEDIKNFSFEDFISVPNYKNDEKFIEYSSEYTSIERRVGYWKDVYGTLKKAGNQN